VHAHTEQWCEVPLTPLVLLSSKEDCAYYRVLLTETRDHAVSTVLIVTPEALVE
jgi:hypothetical protein